MINSSLLKCLSAIPDKRRKQGIRYAQDKTLLLLIIGTLAGRVGFRAIARFCKSHEEELSELLDLKHGTPSHVSLTAIVDGVDFEEFEKAVNLWCKQKYDQGENGTDIIAVDGKAIRSSLKNAINTNQNFVAFVNAFSTNQEMVVSSISYENGNGSERVILRSLVEQLNLTGAVITADAAHCSKKH